MAPSVVLSSSRASHKLLFVAALAVCLFDGAPASANSIIRNAWVNYYDPISIPGNANCQLCHFDTTVPSWNGYGWDIFLALGDLTCDGADGSLPDGAVSLDEAFACIEPVNSDMDPGAFSNIEEIDFGSQPGWTTGPNNTIFDLTGETANQPPPANLEPYDPDGGGGTGGAGGAGGTGGMGGVGGTGGVDMFPPGQFKRRTIVVVSPGQSIQEAIDRAQEGTRIYVLAGVYTEPQNSTNGLNITKSGIQLIGQSNKQKRVVLRATGNQRNGIVIVPPDVPEAAQPVRPGSPPLKRTDCMGCHTDMGPPFPRHADVPEVIPMDSDPWLYDIVVEGITIEGFENNGLFTEHVDGLRVHDVESINNRNYGIFPVLSKNGVISSCRATGSDRDSGIWVETSENFIVRDSIAEQSVNGIEVSNSDDVLLINNELRNNTVGAAILLLPDIYDNRDSAKRIDIRNNWIHDNNKPNTARPGSILSFIPQGIGILYLGVDDSQISDNLIEGNEYVGVAVTDYCVVVQPTPFGCGLDPDTLTPGFLLDQTAKNNRVESNILLNNATNPPGPPFGDYSADLSLLTLPAPLVLPSPPFPPFPFPPEDIAPYHNNCYDSNQPADATFFSLFDALIGVPPPWAPPPCL